MARRTRSEPGICGTCGGLAVGMNTMCFICAKHPSTCTCKKAVA
jgi:hypothetical protein